MKVHCPHDGLVSLSELKSHPKNRNTHPDDQIKRLAKILEYQGWRYPVKVSKRSGFVTSGHGRIEAARKNGWKEAPVSFQEYESDEQEYADVQADNAIASWAELDLSGINFDLPELGPDFDIDLLGIKNFEIDVADKEGLTDPDDVPEHVEPRTKLGDLYQLGAHRLLCGDSTSIDAVERLMGGENADMVFTDPPYGVNFEQGKFIGRDKQGKDRNFSPIANDDKKGEELKDFLRDALTNAALVSDVCSIYVWSPPLVEGFAILQAVIESGWHVQSQIVWNKTPFVIGRADYHWKHEICWYGYKGTNHIWNGGRDKATVWDVAKTRTSDSHPTMKPVELAERACEHNTNRNGKILDLFGGSGSTLIACEKTNRKCFMMELDPHYCDVIVTRWEKFTGQKAELIPSGNSAVTA